MLRIFFWINYCFVHIPKFILKDKKFVLEVCFDKYEEVLFNVMVILLKELVTSETV